MVDQKFMIDLTFENHFFFNIEIHHQIISKIIRLKYKIYEFLYNSFTPFTRKYSIKNIRSFKSSFGTQRIMV